MQHQIEIRGITEEIIEDDYNEGEGDRISIDSHNDRNGIWSTDLDQNRNFLSAITTLTGVTVEDGLSNMVLYDDGRLVIDASLTDTGNGYYDPEPEDLEAFKEGKVRMVVQRVTAYTDMTPETAEALGIEVA